MSFIAAESKSLSLDSPIDSLIEYGHFVGKTGNHIDRLLRKDRLLNDIDLLHSLLTPMQEIVELYNPSVLIGQQRSAVLIANTISKATGIPIVEIPKKGNRVGLFKGINTNRAMMIENNVITGGSLIEALESVYAFDIDPVIAITLFDSNGIQLDTFGSPPLEAVYSLGTKSWHPASCELCRELGASTLRPIIKE
jgi:orotate phosphoribosyltransferase